MLLFMIGKCERRGSERQTILKRRKYSKKVEER
jgi:hypothetical protein